MLLIKRFDADVFARLIEEQGVTTCFAVPTMLFNLLSRWTNPRDMSSRGHHDGRRAGATRSGSRCRPSGLPPAQRVWADGAQPDDLPEPVEQRWNRSWTAASRCQDRVSIRSPEDNRVLQSVKWARFARGPTP